MQPRVSIIILNWNGLKDTVECLESLKKITYPNYEVIVVDNGSRGNDVAVLKEKFGNYIDLIENNRNYGFAEGSNIGIRYVLEKSDIDYILLLNNDVVVAPDFLDAMVKVAEKNAKIGMVTPKIYSYSDPHHIESAGGNINWWFGKPYHFKIEPTDKNKLIISNYLTACVILIKKNVINKIGLLDPEYFAIFEDADYSVKAKKANFELVCNPKARVWHKFSKTTKFYSRNYVYFFSRNRIIFMKKNAKFFFLVFFILFNSLVKLPGAVIYFLIVKKNPHLARAFIKGYWDGIFSNKLPENITQKTN